MVCAANSHIPSRVSTVSPQRLSNRLGMRYRKCCRQSHGTGRRWMVTGSDSWRRTPASVRRECGWQFPSVSHLWKAERLFVIFKCEYGHDTIHIIEACVWLIWWWSYFLIMIVIWQKPNKTEWKVNMEKMEHRINRFKIEHRISRQHRKSIKKIISVDAVNVDNFNKNDCSENLDCYVLWYSWNHVIMKQRQQNKWDWILSTWMNFPLFLLTSIALFYFYHFFFCVCNWKLRGNKIENNIISWVFLIYFFSVSSGSIFEWSFRYSSRI